jgi:hypothetical protein
MIATAFADMLMCVFLTTGLTTEFCRMNIYTADSADESSQETAIALGTRMYAKTYDTQRVPHNKNCSKNTCT